MRVESVHPGLPGPLARLHPLDGVVERVGLQPARPPLSLPAADDQARSLEHLEVARDRGQAHRKRLRQLAHRRLALGEAGQDRAARRIGESGEGEAELIGLHVTYGLNNLLIKYDPIPRCNSTAQPLPSRGAKGYTAIRIATSYFVTEVRSPGVSPDDIALRVSSPRL